MPSCLLRRLVLPFSASAGLVLGLAACGGDGPTACDPYAVGVLEGRVTSAGAPVAVEVAAEPVLGETILRDRVWTTSDSTGWYRFELPTGLYRMHVQDPAVHLFRDHQRDTVRVDRTVRRHDLARGRLELEFMLPAELEGEEFDLRLESPAGGSTETEARVTDGRLAAAFATLVPGEFRVQLRSNRTGRHYLPGTTDRRQAELTTVGPSDPVRLVRDFRPTAAVVRGSVTGAWQHLSGASLKVVAAASSFAKAGEAECRSDGSFEIPVLFPGAFRLSLSGSGFDRWLGGSDFPTAREYDLQPGQELSGLSFTDAGLRGELRGPGDRVHYDFEILLVDEAGNERSTYRGSAHRFALYNLEPGRYRLRVSGNCGDADWAPQWFGGSESLAGAVSVDLGAGEPPTLVFDLVEGGRIHGGVVVPAGGLDPVDYYALYDPAGESVCGSGAWPDRRMHFAGLADGSYRVGASLSYRNVWYYPGTWDPEQAAPVVILDHATVEDLAWPLPDIIPGDR